METQVTAWLNEGLKHYSAGDAARALEAWYRILEVEPAHAAALEYVSFVRQTVRVDADATPPAQLPDPTAAPGSGPDTVGPTPNTDPLGMMAPPSGFGSPVGPAAGGPRMPSVDSPAPAPAAAPVPPAAASPAATPHAVPRGLTPSPAILDGSWGDVVNVDVTLPPIDADAATQRPATAPVTLPPAAASTTPAVPPPPTAVPMPAEVLPPPVITAGPAASPLPPPDASQPDPASTEPPPTIARWASPKVIKAPPPVADVTGFEALAPFDMDVLDGGNNEAPPPPPPPPLDADPPAPPAVSPPPPVAPPVQVASSTPAMPVPTLLTMASPDHGVSSPFGTGQVYESQKDAVSLPPLTTKPVEDRVVRQSLRFDEPPQTSSPTAALLRGDPPVAQVVSPPAAAMPLPTAPTAATAPAAAATAPTAPAPDALPPEASAMPPPVAPPPAMPPPPPEDAASPWDGDAGPARALDLDVGGGPVPNASLEALLRTPVASSTPPAPVDEAPPPPSAPAEPIDELAALMTGARELFELGDFSGSLELVEKVLRTNPDHEGARAYLKRNESTLLRMYESKLGDMGIIPRQLVPPDEVIWLNMHHRAGFILSQVDGTVSYEDLLDISGMDRFDTVRILAELVSNGIIGG